MTIKITVHCEVCGKCFIDLDGEGDDIHQMVIDIQEQQANFNDTGFNVCTNCEDSLPESNEDQERREYRHALGLN